MPEPLPTGEVSLAALKQRLGPNAIGASRYLDAVAELAAGERLEAVVIAMWQRRGWAVVATDAGLRLARRPRLAGPHREFVRLIEAARARLGGVKPTVAELRELAQLKLGRFWSFGFESTIDGLPDRLESGEQVQRLAAASLDFHGLLVLTDRRLLLLDSTLRRANERSWEIDRAEIHAVELVDHGLRLVRAGGETILTDFLPPGRRDEFAAVLC